MTQANTQIDFFGKRIEIFLASKRSNLRSLTEHYYIDGRDFHFKWSKLDLTIEAEQIQLANRISNFGYVNAIKLIHFDKQKNVLITEHIEGGSCFNPIWNNYTWRRFLKTHPKVPWGERLIELTQWFSSYHNLTANSDSELIEKCKCSLKVLIIAKINQIKASTYSPLSHEQCEYILKYIELHFDKGCWESLPIGNIHADITLVNILLDHNSKLHIIDFGDSRLGFFLEDFVQLWSCVWEIAVCSRRKNLHETLTSMLDAFNTKSQHSVEISTSSPEFKILRLYKALNRVYENCHYFYKNKTIPLSTRYVHKKMTKHHLKYILELLDE